MDEVVVINGFTIGILSRFNSHWTGLTLDYRNVWKLRTIDIMIIVKLESRARNLDQTVSVCLICFDWIIIWNLEASLQKKKKNHKKVASA